MTPESRTPPEMPILKTTPASMAPIPASTLPFLPTRILCTLAPILYERRNHYVTVPKTIYLQLTLILFFYRDSCLSAVFTCSGRKITARNSSFWRANYEMSTSTSSIM